MFTSDILSFDEEAFKDIKKTIPLGNSHIGALVYGNVSNEILPLNENTFWVYGTDAKIKKREFYKHIKNVENLIEEDNILEANKYAIENIDSNIGRRALYKTASFLNINYHSGKNISSYNRTLDMGSGEIYVSYIENKHKIERKYFSSIVDDLICVNIESTKIEEIDLSLSNNVFQNQIKDYQNSIPS
ncbi:MAG: glycoside hydrolase family 95 protein [Acholeplasmatales bacterium]|nr:glycoside hydrolase family 95 protein [Acholeplasmatales bacterium]